MSKSRGIRHFRTHRDVLRKADARHCQWPRTWQMGVHHDLSPFGLGRLENRRLTRPSVPQTAPDVLGMDLNCSESRRPERLTGGEHGLRATTIRAISTRATA